MFGIDDAISSVADLINNGIDKIWPDADAESKRKFETYMADVQAKLVSTKGQLDANVAEANSGKSWRHWVGRVCAVSLGLYFIPQYLVAAIVWAKMCYNIVPINGIYTIPVYPASVSGLMELVTGMLGLGVIKAAEKIFNKK